MLIAIGDRMQCRSAEREKWIEVGYATGRPRKDGPTPLALFQPL